jgi:preprotein translocase subunit SecG
MKKTFNIFAILFIVLSFFNSCAPRLMSSAGPVPNKGEALMWTLALLFIVIGMMLSMVEKD